MFKFVELDKMSEDHIISFIEFLDCQDESTQKMYLEYIPFNLRFIKNLLNQQHQFFEEKQKMHCMEEELKESKKKLERKDMELKETNDELNKMKIEEKRMKEELSKYEAEKKQAKIETQVIKSANQQYTQSIIVCGYDYNNGLGEKPNNEAENGTPIISPPVNLSFDPSSLLSYSAYYDHSVLVTSDGSLKGIGNNDGGRISSTLQKWDIDHFTDFCIKDSLDQQLAAVSAVCYVYGTLYMLSKINSNERQLVLCDWSINRGDPVFLDIGNHQPVSLFGGYLHSASIGREGEVIFINRNSVIKSPKSRIASFSLPDGEKASSVAICESSVFVLSSNGRVFTSQIPMVPSALVKERNQFRHSQRFHHF